MALDYVMREVRALRGTVQRCYPTKDRAVALTILSKVMLILWHARYDEYLHTDETFRQILRGEQDNAP